MRCPYCNSPLNGANALPLLGARKQRVYDAVARGGRSGVAAQALVKALYDGAKAPRAAMTVLRVEIHNLNRLIKPNGQRIRGRQHKYYLVGL